MMSSVAKNIRTFEDLRVAVTEVTAELDPETSAWHELAARVRATAADLVLLNEMPFGRWLAQSKKARDDSFASSMRAHDAGIRQFPDLGTRVVLATRPQQEGARRINQAFAWVDGKIVVAHTKQYLPDEEGTWEKRWFERGTPGFNPVEVGVSVGFLICTEVMFTEWARIYRQAGAKIIAVPRASGVESLHRWRTAISMAAIVSGCYVLSSNRSGGIGKSSFGGHGMIVAPSGDLIAETSEAQPVVAAVIDLSAVRKAQLGYPCNVGELPDSVVQANRIRHG